MEVSSVADPILTAAAICGAVAVIGKTILSVIRWGNRMGAAIGFVEQEMRNNGGTSLRDSVDRIEHKVTDLKGTVKEELTDFGRRLDRVEEVVFYEENHHAIPA